MQVQQLTLEGKPIENKPFRYITLNEQKEFCDFLESLNLFPDKMKDLKWCASEFLTYDCTNDSSHTHKVKYLNCGLRGKCPRCSMQYAHKRAEIMYQYIKQNLADKLPFDLKMNQIVLTLPKELHENLDKKTFSKMIRYFMKKFRIEAYCYSIQFRHSKDPLSSRYLHAHALTLNMKEKDSKLIENEYYFDTDLMRDVWKHTIEKFTKTTIQSDVNVHTEYASVKQKKDKIVHLLAYLYRYSIQDLFQVQIRSKSIDYVQETQFDPSNTILQIEAMRNEPKSVVWCGLMTSTKRSYLEGLLQNTINELVIWRDMDYFIKQLAERVKTCRECGYKYSEIPFDKGKYQGDNEPILSNFLVSE